MGAAKAIVQAEDVQIATVAVAIKAIVVGKKQMTQSIFRQLPQARMIDEEKVELLGIPWGHVNYHWGNQELHSRHFIFQAGPMLFRHLEHLRVSSSHWFHRDRPSGYRHIVAEAASLERHRVYAKLLGGWLPRRGDDEFPGSSYRRRMEFYDDEFWVDDLTSRMAFDVLPTTQEMVDEQAWYARNLEEKTAFLATLRDRLGRLYGSVPDPDDISEMLADNNERAVAYCSEWDALMERLRGVEQLFIAV